MKNQTWHHLVRNLLLFVNVHLCDLLHFLQAIILGPVGISFLSFSLLFTSEDNEIKGRLPLHIDSLLKNNC